MFRVAHPFAPRPTRFLELRDHRGWRLKVYSIICGDDPLDRDGFDRGVDLALAGLPATAVTAARPGAGFVILHQGRGADYVVLCWWDRENELPMRIVVRERGEDGTPSAWRTARENESVCVWDLDVIWFERNAYVETVLAPDARDPAAAINAYLARTRPDSPLPATPSSPR
jgi:hypothetical protein